MPVNLPQPLFVPGGGNQRSTAEQALLSFLGQAPGLAFTLHQTLQQNQQNKAAQDAALKALFLEAQAGNPEALGAFGTEGLGISPIPSPIEGQPDAPGAAPTAQMLDRLSSDQRRTLAALVPELTGMQTRRLQRTEEVRREAQETRSIQAHEKAMEQADVAIRGQNLVNDIRTWEKSVLPMREETLRLENELKQAEVDFIPLRRQQIELGLQSTRQQMVLQAQEQGLRHWDSLQQNIADLIRSQTIGVQAGTVEAGDARQRAMDITNGLLQGRSQDDFMKLYEEYFAAGPPTPERRSEFYAKLAGDTWQTMAVNYGYSTEEAVQFRDDLEAPDANMRTVYRNRMKQLDTAEQIQLNQVQSDEEKAQIEAYFAQERVNYRFLINLWRQAHDMPRVTWPEIREKEDKGHLSASLEHLIPKPENILDFQTSVSNPLLPLMNPAAAGAELATQLGIIPQTVPDQLNLGPLGSFEKRPFFPPGQTLEETMFGPQNRNR